MSATAQSSSPDAGGDRDRIVNLSDGVFAIAITLLLLDIRVPDIPENLVASCQERCSRCGQSTSATS